MIDRINSQLLVHQKELIKFKEHVIRLEGAIEALQILKEELEEENEQHQESTIQEPGESDAEVAGK